MPRYSVSGSFAFDFRLPLSVKRSPAPLQTSIDNEIEKSPIVDFYFIFLGVTRKVGKSFHEAIIFRMRVAKIVIELAGSFCPQVGVGASGAIYAIMGAWLSHVICTWNEEDEFAKGAQLSQVRELSGHA